MQPPSDPPLVRVPAVKDTEARPCVKAAGGLRKTTDTDEHRCKSWTEMSEVLAGTTQPFTTSFDTDLGANGQNGANAPLKKACTVGTPSEREGL